jgi:succinate dehydrogenase / fumarate reductase membrane anchor subunit
MATPLAKVRGLGSARSGTETFWRQRLTAVANIPLILFLIYTVVTHVGADYADVRTYMAQPIVATLLLALVINAAIHMRIGLKEIIEDYVHGAGKVPMLLLATFFAAFVGLASIYAIIKISLGS